uniref:GDSL esterase/lipase At4g01130 n=1 Tax=Anthurium amnicola TaxID=1678845 RepID=A0A1D1YVQ0_9ARAE
MGFPSPPTHAGNWRAYAAAALLWWVVVGMHAVPSGARCDFRAVFNFGDSNSDTGGFWAAFPAQSAPWGITFFGRPAGRASDGRLVLDFLAQAVGIPFLSPYLRSIGSNYKHGANYATLASTVLLPNTSLFVTGISPFSLAIQLNQMKQFKSGVLELSPKGYLPSKNIFGKSLYTLDIGQNDFTSNLAAIGIEGVKQYLPQVASQIAWTIKELYALGGRAFLVFNLAPIGCYPAFLMELPHNSSDLDEYGCMVSYNDAVADYNNMLRETLRQTRSALADAAVVYVDTHAVKLELFRHPNAHGLLYGTRACCGRGGGANNFDPRVFCGNSKVIDGKPVTAGACSDPQNYVSWDGIHATEAANKLVAGAVLNGSYSEPHFPFSMFCDLHPIG